MTEPKAEYMTESTELLPCPFCGGKADPTGWMADSGGNFISGPECEGCGATAQSIEQWNTRPDDNSRWIPVEERLPEIGQQILAKHQYDNGDFFAVLVTYTVFGFPIAMWGESQVVTHWKPID